jgi:aryl-alcohol dehydrogenase-like predicted oxidoreductase
MIQRPGISSVIIGARNEEQLRRNLGAIGWALTANQIAALDEASSVKRRILLAENYAHPNARS